MPGLCDSQRVSCGQLVSHSIQKFTWLRGFQLSPQVPKLWGKATFLATCHKKHAQKQYFDKSFGPYRSPLIRSQLFFAVRDGTCWHRIIADEGMTTEDEEGKQARPPRRSSPNLMRHMLELHSRLLSEQLISPKSCSGFIKTSPSYAVAAALPVIPLSLFFTRKHGCSILLW